MIHVIHFNHTNGDLEYVRYYCCLSCMEEGLVEDIGELPDNYQSGISGEIKTKDINLSYGGWPGGSETDQDTCCETCLTVIWEGIENGQ